MNKIPVLATIRAAYGFAFGHLGAIIGAIWLPMVVVSVTGFFVMQHYYDASIEALSSVTPAVMGPVLLMLLGYLLVALLLQAIIYAAVTQLALGARQGGMMHFTLGPVEWRLFRAMLSLVGLLFLLAVIAALVAQGAALGLRAAGVAPAQSLAGQALLQLVFVGAFVFVALRFVFLLPVVAVSEAGPVLPRAWLLTGGNFWRIFVIYLALFAPVLTLVIGIEVALLKPNDFVAANGAVNQVAALQRMRAILPLLQGMAFFLSPFLSGLRWGPAWRPGGCWRRPPRTRCRARKDANASLGIVTPA